MKEPTHEQLAKEFCLLNGIKWCEESNSCDNCDQLMQESSCERFSMYCVRYSKNVSWHIDSNNGRQYKHRLEECLSITKNPTFYDAASILKVVMEWEDWPKFRKNYRVFNIGNYPNRDNQGNYGLCLPYILNPSKLLAAAIEWRKCTRLRSVLMKTGPLTIEIPNPNGEACLAICPMIQWEKDRFNCIYGALKDKICWPSIGCPWHKKEGEND